ncbi:undecaprenyl/decaprenyl-phosphate alpha-N-acetylglucosaminyl 1-phosphate transferase [Bacteroidia bacterium]|nr:undecaprenyl/decaprenyl-phosphate alpha-N-acetylglucosaminyl 1-phosphate transferase [Bacteroidia bacterium]GHT06004.1 undecaprenyl/decaprenyl-phosphate alpha-N-acetylglucosaminyl 1-phosphate transferase [Bacteroidia bacterium]
MGLNILITVLLSLSISIFTTYNVIRFSKHLNLGDAPSEARKIHKIKIPNFGGIAVFIATMVAYFTFSDYSNTIRPDRLFTISIFLFFIGMADDMDGISPGSRLIMEFLCAFFIIAVADIRLTTLWGIFGITDLPIVASYIITSLFIVGCINAYNMIDGIDGLLGSLSLLGSACFGFIFYSEGEWLWTILCAAICGALAGFLYYNRYPAKIFMGNGGSLFLGTIFACFSVRMMQIEPTHEGIIYITAPNTMVFSIIAIPVIDMIATFAIRIYYGDSPFEADQCHIHHRMMTMGLNQNQTCLIIILLNIFIMVFAYFVQDTGVLRSLFYTILFCVVLESIIVYFSLFYKKGGLSKNI